MLENYKKLIFMADGQAQPGGGILGTIIMFGAMFAIFYFILIRPQQKQQKKHAALLSSLKKGDEVILNSGIIGKIFSVEDKIIWLEINDKSKIKVLKQSVANVIANEPEAPKA